MYTPGEHWYRWILISATKKFQDFADDLGIPFYIRGTYRNHDYQRELIEFYMSAPTFNQLSINCFKISADLIVCFNADTSSDYQADIKLAGKIVEQFSEICVLDSEDNFFCRLLPSKEIIVNNFGKKESSTKLVTGSVEASYESFVNR